MKAPYIRPEQRREMRNDFPAGQLFIVDLISRSHALRTFGIVLNISKGGMAVQSFRPLPAGHIAEIRHCFSKSPLYAGAGQVVWKKEGGLAGLRFLNGRLKGLPELRQRGEMDGTSDGSDASLPLVAYRSNSSTNAFDSTLHLLACSAMALTDAAGVAIVIGNSSVMECRASVGTAPEVGTQLHPDSGLSGHSMRTGSVILCDDAWEDGRVNVAAARQMDTRSILIVPITMAGSVVGLLEAFSRETNHFDEGHVQRLQPIITVLASVPELETASPSPSPEAAPEQIQVVVAGDSGAVLDPVQDMVPEEPAVTAPVEADVREELAGVQLDATESAIAEPSITGMVASAELSRSRAVPVIGGVIAALVIVLAALSVFTIRFRSKSPDIRNSTSSTQYAPSSSGASGQGAIAPAKPEIRFDPPAINQKVGETFGVNILLKNAQDILSAPMQIRYDPAKLQVVSVESGGLFDRAGQPGTLDRRVDATTGSIDLAISQPFSAQGNSDSGSLVALTFRSKVPGLSHLQVNPVELRDASNHVTMVNGAAAFVEVSPSPTKAENKPAEPTIATKNSETKDSKTKSAAPVAQSSASPAKAAAPTTKSTTRIAPPALRSPSESKPEATLKASADVVPESPKPESPKVEAGALMMEGVPPGTEVWLDSQPLTATAPSGRVAIRNIPPGTHHLRMLLHNYQYYDQFIDLKPGEVVNVKPETGGI
jgi:putative methionine-R-sulfoxide reductase with GAF domain